MIIENFEIVELSSENIDTALSLTEKFVGKGLYTPDYFFNIISDSNYQFSFLKHKEEFKGYFHSFICEANEVKDKTGIEIKDAEDLPPDTKVGICKSIGLEKDIRGKGISDKLLNHFTNQLTAKGAEVIFVPAWVKNGVIPAGPLLERCGFRYIGLSIKPWYNFIGLECPYCKKNRCICDAAIFKKSERKCD